MNQPASDGSTATEQVASLHVVDLLLGRGANIRGLEPLSDGERNLMRYIVTSYLNVMSPSTMLPRSYYYVTCPGPRDATLVSIMHTLAVLDKKEDALTWLLERGAPADCMVGTRPHRRCSLIQLAVASGCSYRMLDELIAFGADLNRDNYPMNDIPLSWACHQKDIGLAEFLLNEAQARGATEQATGHCSTPVGPGTRSSSGCCSTTVPM